MRVISLLLLLLLSPLLFADEWWNEEWECRKKVKIPSLLGKWEYYTKIGAVIFSNGGKIKEDGSDIRVISEKGVEVPYYVVYSSPYRYSLIAFPISEGSSFYYIYFGNPKAESPGYQWEPRAGLILETREKPPGGANNWKEMKNLLSRSKKIYGRSFWGKIFDGYNPFGPSDNYLSIYKGYFYAPTTGTYSFATASDDASFLFIDGKMVAQWPGYHRAGGGRRAEHHGEIFLSRGVHKLEYYHMEGRGAQVCALYWRKPRDSYYEVMKENYFLPVTWGRVEEYQKRENPYPADFSYTLDSNFWFDSHTFTLVYFKSTSPVGYLEWDFGDGVRVKGLQSVSHIFLTLGEKRVRLKRTVWIFHLKDGRKIAGEVLSSSPSLYMVKVEGGVEKVEREEIEKVDRVEDVMERIILLRSPLPERRKETLKERKLRYKKILDTYPFPNLKNSDLEILLQFYEYLKDLYGQSRILWNLSKKTEGERKVKYLFSLAKCYHSLGKKREALKTYEFIEKIAPSPYNFEATYQKSIIYLEEGALNKAEKALREIISSPDNPTKRLAYLALGDVYLKKGEWEKAKEEYKKAIPAHNPLPEGVYLQRAEYFLSIKDLERLKETIQEWGEAYPLSRISLIPYFKGWLLYYEGRWKEAKEEWEILLKSGESILTTRAREALKNLKK